MQPAVPINMVAILLCVVANMILGFLWYGPFFGKMWIKEMGWSKQEMEAAKKKGMTKQVILAAIGALVMAFVLQHSLVFASTYLQITGVMAGVQAGFWNWLGFVVPVLLSSVLWEGKSWRLWFIGIGYYLVAMIIMGVILATM